MCGVRQSFGGFGFCGDGAGLFVSKLGSCKESGDAMRFVGAKLARERRYADPTGRLTVDSGH
jgi:hypothetical protein